MYTFDFGRWAGRSLQDVIEQELDEEYVQWCCNNLKSPARKAAIQKAYAEYLAPTREIEENYKVMVREICKEIGTPAICQIIRSLSVHYDRNTGTTIYMMNGAGNALITLNGEKVCLGGCHSSSQDDEFVYCSCPAPTAQERVWTGAMDKTARTLEEAVAAAEKATAAYLAKKAAAADRW